MKARRPSVCLLCRGPVGIGEQIGKYGRTWVHVSCIIQRQDVTGIRAARLCPPSATCSPNAHGASSSSN